MNKKKSKNSGFSLVEMMLALVILAVLMTAVAVAFDASVKNYHDNETISKTMNTARAALLRITNDIRTAQAVAVIGGTGDPDNSQCSLVTAVGQNLVYRFDSAGSKLYLDRYESGTWVPYVLCENVTAMTFNRAAVPSQSNLIRNVRISMTVTNNQGQMPQTLVTAAVVRRNL